MKKGKKIKAEVRLDSNRTMQIEGKVKEERTVFGRNEVLIDVTKVNPIWITVEKLT